MAEKLKQLKWTDIKTAMGLIRTAMVLTVFHDFGDDPWEQMYQRISYLTTGACWKMEKRLIILLESEQWLKNGEQTNLALLLQS